MALHSVDATAGVGLIQRSGSRLLAGLRNRLTLGLVTRAVHIGLRRAIGRGLPIPATQVPLLVRPLAPADLDVLLPVETAGLSRVEKGDVKMRRHLAAHASESCFVAVDKRSGEPCFMAWLIGAGSDVLRLLEGVPPLEPHQAIVEYAYVPPRHRGLGLMAPCGLMVAEQALAIGATETIAFIGEINIPSLRGARRAGFTPYMRHVRTHLLFGMFQFDRFIPLRDGEDGWPAGLDRREEP
jgi:hypothetical protein